MQLSVIIVGYNTQHFIQLCLDSVMKALKNLEAEVIVVDNASEDDSCAVISQKFPQVRLIENAENLGFSKANNVGLKEARGKFALLLNPDTVLPEDCFEKCLTYLELNPEVGALGVRMMDGAGAFLPESKRGLPTPKTAFYKMSGLYKLFPTTPGIARYYHGEFPEKEINKVEVLTGAFFLAQKSIGDKLGWLDEDYFMYGEDIDLSYSFTKDGHALVYFPDTSIVHFKGESSKNVDKKYIQSFFGAMGMFYRKHFSKEYSGFLQALVLIGIRIKSVLRTLRQSLFSFQFKAKIKTEEFILVGTRKESIHAFEQIVGHKAKEIITPDKLVKLKYQKGVSLVFTSDFNYKKQLEKMKPGNHYYFMSSDGSFILGSPSKKRNGVVLERKADL